MTTDKTTEQHVSDTGTQVRRDAERAAGTVGSDLKSATDEVRRDAGRAAHAVADEAAVAAQKAEGMANEQKNAMASHLDGIAGAIRHAADDLDGESSPGARVTREAADRVAQLSKALRENSIGDLAGVAEDFGRRQPVAFLGASMLAGFAASRFLVASGHRRQASLSPATTERKGAAQ